MQPPNGLSQIPLRGSYRWPPMLHRAPLAPGYWARWSLPMLYGAMQLMHVVCAGAATPVIGVAAAASVACVAAGRIV